MAKKVERIWIHTGDMTMLGRGTTFISINRKRQEEKEKWIEFRRVVKKKAKKKGKVKK